jgi:ABC-2 type transport system ATP-binding protein
VAEADAVRGLVSPTGQYASVDEDLTGWENLVLLARLLGHTRAQAKARASELLDAFGLTDAAGRLASSYSGGMRRRLDIAASIVVTPSCCFSWKFWKRSMRPASRIRRTWHGMSRVPGGAAAWP